MPAVGCGWIAQRIPQWPEWEPSPWMNLWLHIQRDVVYAAWALLSHKLQPYLCTVEQYFDCRWHWHNSSLTSAWQEIRVSGSWREGYSSEGLHFFFLHPNVHPECVNVKYSYLYLLSIDSCSTAIILVQVNRIVVTAEFHQLKTNRSLICYSKTSLQETLRNPENVCFVTKVPCVQCC